MAFGDSLTCMFESRALSSQLDMLWVQQWRGEEGVSQPYRFEIRLASTNPLFDEEVLLGQRATLALVDAQGLPHPYHGVVTAVEYLDADSIYRYYQVVLEPRMVQLRNFCFSEIWLNKSLPELIREVLALADIRIEGPGAGQNTTAGYDFDIRLPLDDISATQASFTCQFEESSFAFLSRLLEYFGVYYFFEQNADGEALVLCGDQRFQPQIPSLVSYQREDSELEVGRGLNIARMFQRKLTRQVAKVTLQDFSATSAQLQLQVSASVTSASLAPSATELQLEAQAGAAGFFGERSVYGEHFGSTEQGQWLASRRAQAIGCRHCEFHGSGRATGLRAGHPMVLAGHPRPSFNANYQVIEVRHDGYQPLPGVSEDGVGAAWGSNTHFIALPGDVQFRPPNVTPKPSVKGLFSAVVDGDQDSTRPMLNEHGCYKVIFPFIRGEKEQTRGSAWVRMATMSSGASHGMNFPLLKGTEVLISFLGGDPDKPVIIGSVPNSENLNRVTEKNATQSGLSTPGGHLFAMDDSPGGRLMKVSSSTGSSLTLGEGDVSGAHMRTNKHMEFASSSYRHEVPGVYSMTVGGGTPPEPGSAGTNEASLRSNFTGVATGSNSGLEQTPGVMANQKSEEHENKEPDEDKEEDKDEEKESEEELAKDENAPYFIETKEAGMIIETTLAGVSLEANIGALKTELNAHAVSVEINLAGVVVEISANKWEYLYHNFKKELAPAKQIEALSERQEIAMSELTSKIRKLEAEVYKLSTTTGISLSSMGSALDINSAGISLESTLIMLKGDVMISGTLNVIGDASFDSDLSVIGDAGFVKLGSSAIRCGTLDAGSATLATPYIPPNVVAIEAKMVEMQTGLTAFQALQVEIGTTLEVMQVAQDALFNQYEDAKAITPSEGPAPTTSTGPAPIDTPTPPTPIGF